MLKTTITVRKPKAGPLYQVDVELTEYITNDGERFFVGYDDKKNRYEKTLDVYNNFGWPESIWIKRSGF